MLIRVITLMKNAPVSSEIRYSLCIKPVNGISIVNDYAQAKHTSNPFLTWTTDRESIVWLKWLYILKLTWNNTYNTSSFGGGGHINLRFFLFVLLFCCLTSCQPIKGRAKCYASLNLHVYDTTARGKLALCVYNLWTNSKLYIHFIQQDLLFVNSDVILYCGFLYEKLYLCNHDIHVPCSHKH